MAYESFRVFKEPQCLIESSKDGKLEVVNEVLTQISQIKDRLNVVAITGIYKTGKSYLLNRLANANKASEVTTPNLASTSETSTTSVASTSSAVATSTRQTTSSSDSTGTPQTTITSAVSTTSATTSISSQTSTSSSSTRTSTTGFPLRSTFESETKGIWAWCRPHLTRKDEVILLLDTEGLGDINKGDCNHDNWIFTLAMLLADTLVYNAKGTFDQDALEKLRFITEMSKHVTISANKKEDNFNQYFPRFILALRDFTLELKKDGMEITSDEYLEYCLNFRAGADESAIRYNKPRKCIKKYFKERKCFTFETPGNKTVLINLETLRDEDLTKEFVEDSKRFTTYVLDKCDSKSLSNGKPVNGGMFATLTQTYVSAIRDGKIPCIESALELMAQRENSKAVEACVQLYLKKMNSILKFPVLNENGLSEAHQDCFNEAITLFREKAVYDRGHKYDMEAHTKINAEYENLKKTDERESKVRCDAALAHLNKTIETNIRNNVYARSGGYNLYQNDILDIKNKYNEKSDLGCKKEETISKYLANKWTEGQIILQADQIASETEKEAEIKRQIAIALEVERKKAEVSAETQRKKHEDEKEKINQQLEQQKQQQEDDHKKTSEKMEKDIASLQEENKNLQKETSNLGNIVRSLNSTIKEKGSWCVLM